jgi:fatty acid desaturase
VQSFPPSYYIHQLKHALMGRLSTPAASRLWWLPVHVSFIVLGTVALARGWLPWPLAVATSLLIGFAFAGLMFLGHETMHGGVLHGRWRRAKSLVGFLCFAPLTLSPRLWSVWHNRMHHANSNRLDVDPDMYPSLDRYRASRSVRFATDNFALGGRRWRGVLCLLIGFSVQSVHVLIAARTQLRMSKHDHRRAIVETLLSVAWWIAMAITIGAGPFLLAFVLPVVVANVVVMAFILTNHGLSSATEDNDPLLGALSVTAPRWVEWLTLDFGYHVEHHLFPATSGRHLRRVRAALIETWPQRYQTMPLRSALARMFSTGRVYRGTTTLVDPRSGGAWPALAPREAASSR